ncbi:MAG: HNH endonuclease [Gemmataceae bacterium]|nr:HNH endonuclease [Gemmataceae bacterium]
MAHRAGHRCEYCHAPEAIFNFPFEVEHIIPTSLLGEDVEDNLALACRACNLRKSAHLVFQDEATNTTHRLFHPRTDRWADEFRLNVEKAVIEGITPIGRATVACLQMNSSSQLEARKLWIRLGLMPFVE